jgi:hypothetical protein
MNSGVGLSTLELRAINDASTDFTLVINLSAPPRSTSSLSAPPISSLAALSPSSGPSFQNFFELV